MTSFADHVEPKGRPVSHTLTGGPPVTGTFRIAPSAQKPIQRQSGENIGLSAPSVPATGVASALSSVRRYSLVIPSCCPVKVKVRPSGDSATAVRLGRDLPKGARSTGLAPRNDVAG